MSSPLLPYAKALLLFEEEGAPTVINGRFVSTPAARHVIQAYLSRIDQATDYPVSTEKAPDFSGASGASYVYRGYGLLVAELPEGDPFDRPTAEGLTWTPLSTESTPSWLVPGLGGRHIQGNEGEQACRVVRATGRYGGMGIDAQVSSYIKGIPLTILSGDVLN